MHMPTLKRQWTTDDLRDLPDDGNRYEVIDGELFVTPAPSWEASARRGRVIPPRRRISRARALRGCADRAG
jgi:Uma2 family endonuclease